MEAAIKQRAESEPVSELTALVLDELKFKEMTPSDAALLRNFTSLSRLSCNRTGLSSLAHFPALPGLETLELTDNFLNEKSHLETLCDCSKLRSLSLSGNKIKSIEDIKCLVQLQTLENLELELNPLADTAPNYRVELFKLMPSLKVIDSQDKDGNEVEYESDDDEEDDEADREARQSMLKDFYEKKISDDEEDEDEYNPNAEDDESSDDEEEEEEEEDLEQITSESTGIVTEKRRMKTQSAMETDDGSLKEIMGDSAASQ